jgi:hypothetical protein
LIYKAFLFSAGHFLRAFSRFFPLLLTHK